MDRKDPLYRVMKKNIHLFDQYHSRLNNEKAWMRGCFRNERTGKLLELTNRDLVEMILDCEECADFKPAYDLYQEFLDILRSLTYTAYYRRNGITYKTSFNNGFCESKNKVKLVKRNAFGYKYFINLRKRILLHLGFRYTLNFEETKKG